MTDTELQKRRFPIGLFNPGNDISPADVSKWVEDIRMLPEQLKAIAAAITPERLDSTYRPGSWTAKQVIHHIADSHINAYGRIKRTLTEDCPTILPYNEGAWAKLPDVAELPVEVSLNILTGIHHRLHASINDLSLLQLTRHYKHAAANKPESMAYLIGKYSWHGRHHLGHLKLILEG